MRAVLGCIPCAILMKLSGFVGISMSNLNSQFDCICLRGLDFIGVLSLGCMFPQVFLCGVMRRWFICSVWCYIIVCLFTRLPTLSFSGRITILRTYTRPLVTDRVAWSVCRSVCHTSEPYKNGWTDRDAFGLRTLLAPRNHVLGGVHIPMGTDNFRRKVRPIVKYRDTLRSSVQKRLNRSRCCLGFGLG